MNQTFTINEIATKLNLSSKTLRRWEESGRFSPSRTFGNQRRYTVDDLQILDAIKHNLIPAQSELLDVAQATAYAGVSHATLELWTDQGKLHPFMTSSKLYYLKSELHATPSSPTDTSPIQTTSSDPLDKYDLPPVPLQPPTQQESKPIPQPHLSPLHTSTGSPTLNIHSFSPHFLPLTILINLLITSLCLAGYFLATRPYAPISPKPSNQSGLVQGATTTQDPTLSLLKNLFDPYGNFTTVGSIISKASITTPLVSLSPSGKPKDIPGALYFDASTQTLKLYSNSGWQDLGGTPLGIPAGTTVLTGIGTLLKGKKSVVISQPTLTENTTIQVTFLGSYAPASSYWLTKSKGSFTLQTSEGVAADAAFSYLLINK